MNQWKAFGRTVWEPHMDGETRIADCDTEHAARQIATLPAIAAMAEELLTAYKVERDSIASWATEPGTTIIDPEYNDCLALMTDLINRAENTIKEAKNTHAR